MVPDTLSTERFTLVTITPAVIHNLFNTMKETDILQFFNCDQTSLERFRLMHEQGMECYRHSLRFFLVREKGSNVTIGECGFHTWNTHHRRAELFYLLRSDEYKRKGIMTEAVTAVLQHGFTDMNLHRVCAFVDADNVASVSLLSKFGFTFEGTQREDYNVDGTNTDSDCYSLLKQEWREELRMKN